MKRFITCFLITAVLIVAANLAAVEARPLDVIPRLLFYFGLPGAVLLGSISILVEERIEKFSHRHDGLLPAKAATDTHSRKAA